MTLKIHMCPKKKRKKIRALKLHNISSLIIILNLVGFNSNERTSCGTSSQISTQKANRLPIPSPIIDMQAAFVITMKSTLGFSGCGVPLCDQKRASQVLKPSTGELRNNLTPTSFLLLYNWFIFNATVNGSNPQQPASFPPPLSLHCPRLKRDITNLSALDHSLSLSDFFTWSFSSVFSPCLSRSAT